MAEATDHSLREFLVAARRSIKGFTWGGTYREACALLTGYAIGSGDDRVDRGFSAWLADRQHVGHEHVFWNLVLEETAPGGETPDPAAYSPEDDAAAVDRLFELLLEYLDAPEAKLADE